MQVLPLQQLLKSLSLCRWGCNVKGIFGIDGRSADTEPHEALQVSHMVLSLLDWTSSEACAQFMCLQALLMHGMGPSAAVCHSGGPGAV